jgi:tetratricopeptide (TPR) repeat protein
MALLIVREDFSSRHGTTNVRKSEYVVELALSGPINREFVRGLDSAYAKTRLRDVVATLRDQYLDAIVGRATVESVACYMLYQLRDLCPESLRVYEDSEQCAQVSLVDINVEHFETQLCFSRGVSLLLRGLVEDAVNEFERAIGLNGSFVRAHNALGRCHRRLGRLDLAIAAYSRAIEMAPDFGEAHRNRGNAYLDMGNFTEMMTDLERAVQLMPDSAIAWNNRGYAYQRLGKYDLAICDHTAAIRRSAAYAEAFRDRGDAYAAIGEVNLARADHEVADRLAPIQDHIEIERLKLLCP